MVSFDAAALFPSVPIGNCIQYIHSLLTQDKDLHKCTQLTPSDITDLIKVCLSSSDFLYNDRHHTTKDSGPIGLSLMVLVSRLWMTHAMDSAIDLARQRLLAVPRHIFIYMDDIWCVIKTPLTPQRTGLRSSNQPRSDPAEDFRGCLHAVHPRVQFTMEHEEENSIAFLDTYVTQHDNGTLTTKIYRKLSNTNIGQKPQSCQDPKIIAASFKVELCRCYRLCTSLEQTKKEIQFTLDNGNYRKKLQAIADAFEPPVYRNQFPCLDQSVYIGQTTRACDLRWKEHGNAMRTENWSHSGISQLHQNCTHEFDPKNASVITTAQGKHK